MPSSRSLAELGDFLAALRVNGVPVGPEEIDRLRRLFALAPNLERQGLQSLLRALLVKTPEHRQTFEALFADWCPARDADWQEDVGYAPELPPIPELEPPPARVPPTTDDTIAVPRCQVLRSILSFLSGVALLALLLWGLWPRPVVVTPPQEPAEVAVKLPPAPSSRPDDLPATPVDSVWFWQAHVKPFAVPRRLTPLELAALGLFPLATALLVSLRYHYKFREIKPLEPSQGHGWQPLPLPERDDTALMAASERRQLVWNIEHFLSDDPTRRLDLPLTVEATARAGGFVQLHFQPAVYDRTIWFWLDRQLEHATPRLAVHQLMTTLRAAGLEAQQGLFTDVPDRVDWPAQSGYMPEHEEGHGRQAVVAILTDGAGLQQRLDHPLSCFATERLLRYLQHWPRLCFVDCSADGASLRAVLAPYRLETIALEALPWWLGGVVARDQAPVRQALYGDERAWAGAVALGGTRVEAASAHTLRAELGLQVSPWQIERLINEVQDPGNRTRHINWLLRCEPPGEDGLPATDSLVRRALEWWQRRYQKAAAQMQAQENPLLPWQNSLASRRWQVEQAVLRLYLDPVGAAEQLARLANAELREEIRERLAVFAAAEHAEKGRHDHRVIYLPWRLDTQPVLTRYRLRRLGFAGKVEKQEVVALQRSLHLVLAVAMLVTLGLTAWGNALYRWLKPEVPHVQVDNRVYERPVFVAQTINHKEPLATGGYQVTLGSARQTVTLDQVPAGAVMPVEWRWQAELNAIALQGSTVLRAGRLAQPIRACSQGWPQRALVVIAAAFEQEMARQLAIRMLDKGSADQVLLGEHWEEALPEWLGSSRALNQNTQVLVVVPRASDAERAVGQMVKHPGSWAVVVSEDVAGIARALDFAGIRAVEQVAAPWRVHRVQGQVFVSGGPERKEEAGIEWVHVCPGTFTMGRLPGEDAIAEQEKEAKWREWFQREIVEPQRTIVLSAFQMAATETTQQQYGETGAFPEVDVNWADARAYCRKIGADLPTEAQWEYAARGGSRFPWSFGDAEGLLKDYAWFKENSSDPTLTPTGTF